MREAQKIITEFWLYMGTMKNTGPQSELEIAVKSQLTKSRFCTNVKWVYFYPDIPSRYASR